MKLLLVIIIFFLSLNTCAQNKNETIIKDANGEILKTENNDVNPNNLNKTIELFYANINDAKKLDNLMSFRFYQKTPFNKFKELTIEKSKNLGQFLSKKIIKTEFSPDKNAVKYLINVTYKNAKTKEDLVLIKETETDNFKVFEYNYKIEK